MWDYIKAKQLWKPVAGVMLGGIAGFGYYYFIGCAAGTCPIQSNPYIMTGYGVLLGLVFGIPGQNKHKEQSSQA